MYRIFLVAVLFCRNFKRIKKTTEQKQKKDKKQNRTESNF
jgi:hypothetical protein